MEGTSNVQLFWQGKDDFIYYSAWDSGHNSWDNAVKLTIGAIIDTPVAAGVIYQGAAEAVSRLYMGSRLLSNM